jgi:hypothetical protein
MGGMGGMGMGGMGWGSNSSGNATFAEQGDLCLLGARSLEGMNLTVDPAHKKLVAAGPLPAASNETE